MTDSEWADENPAPSKKLVPTWLWFCGGGCLLAVVLAVVVIIMGISMVEEAQDPDIQYAKLEKRIEFDQRPEEWELLFGIPFGVEAWTFKDSRGYVIFMLHIEESDVEESRRQMFDPDFDGSVAGMGGRKEMELTQITVQGRELDMMTYYQASGGGPGGANAGQAACLDITRPGDAGMLIMMLIRQGGQGQVTAEEAIEVLVPFHVGPDR